MEQTAGRAIMCLELNVGSLLLHALFPGQSREEGSRVLRADRKWWFSDRLMCGTRESHTPDRREEGQLGMASLSIPSLHFAQSLNNQRAERAEE